MCRHPERALAHSFTLAPPEGSTRSPQKVTSARKTNLFKIQFGQILLNTTNVFYARTFRLRKWNLALTCKTCVSVMFFLMFQVENSISFLDIKCNTKLDAFKELKFRGHKKHGTPRIPNSISEPTTLTFL